MALSLVDLVIVDLLRNIPRDWPYTATRELPGAGGQPLLLSARRCYKQVGGESVLTGGMVVWIAVPYSSYLPKKTSFRVKIRKDRSPESAAPAVWRLYFEADRAAKLAAARHFTEGLFDGLTEPLRQFAREEAARIGRTTQFTQMALEDCRFWERWIHDTLYGT